MRPPGSSRVFRRVATRCHQKDFQTPVLNHVAAGFPTTCESCHTVDTWFNAKFDHLKYTGYALTGAHATLPCTACHINNVFAGTPATCYAATLADFINSNNPPHVQLGLPHDCGTCHSTSDWLNAKFDHTLYANYPLTGMHATVTVRAMPRQQQLRVILRRLATRATRPTSPEQQIRITSRRDSRPIARCATRPPAGARRPSITLSVFPLTGAHVDRSVRAVPHQQQLHNAADNCYGCHQGGLERHHQSESCGRRLSDHVRHVPHHDQLDERQLQSQQYATFR